MDLLGNSGPSLFFSKSEICGSGGQNPRDAFSFGICRNAPARSGGSREGISAGKQLQTCDVGERIVNRFVEARVPLDRGQIDFGARAIRCCIKHLSLDTGPSCN